MSAANWFAATAELDTDNIHEVLLEQRPRIICYSYTTSAPVRSNDRSITQRLQTFIVFLFSELQYDVAVRAIVIFVN